MKAHGAVMATRPASMPLTIMPGSGLPVLRIITNIAVTAPKAPAMAVLVATTANWTSVAASVEAALKPNQPNSRMKQPSMAIGMWWPGQRVGRAVLVVLADAGTEHDGTGEAGDAADGVHDAGAGEVDVAGTEAHGVPGLGEPAAAPGPGPEDRVVDGAAEQAPPDEGVPLPPLGHGPGGDRGHGVHEGHHVEEEADDGRAARGGDGVTGEGEAALPQEHPVAAADEGIADGLRCSRSRSPAARSCSRRT